MMTTFTAEVPLELSKWSNAGTDNPIWAMPDIDLTKPGLLEPQSNVFDRFRVIMFRRVHIERIKNCPLHIKLRRQPEMTVLHNREKSPTESTQQPMKRSGNRNQYWCDVRNQAVKM